jgi:hypothetical protein
MERLKATKHGIHDSLFLDTRAQIPMFYIVDKRTNHVNNA